MLNDRSLLIAEDDEALKIRLGQAMEKRGFTVFLAGSMKEALVVVHEILPAFAVVDLQLGDGNGLQVVEALNKQRGGARSIIMTGYGSLPTAVSAVKAGAMDYLPKPSDADAIESALIAPKGSHAAPPEKTVSIQDLQLEHIERVYNDTDQNVSETARRLNMHRRTLQRIMHRSKEHGRLLDTFAAAH